MYDPGQAVLRWYESADTLPREVTVTLIEIAQAKAALLCTTHIPEKTKVYLIGENYTVSAIVNSCLVEESGFRICLELEDVSRKKDLAVSFDPGVVQVESWLSDEAEAQILKDLGSEIAPG